MSDYAILLVTPEFLATLLSRDFTHQERQRFLRAMGLLDANAQHPSSRVHQLQGGLKGHWSAAASEELRITFERVEGGKKRLIACSRHYQ